MYELCKDECKWIDKWRCMNYVRMNVKGWMGEDVWTM